MVLVRRLAVAWDGERRKEMMVLVKGLERGAVQKEEEDMMAVVVRTVVVAPLLVYICMSRHTAIIKHTFTRCAVASISWCWPGHTYTT